MAATQQKQRGRLHHQASDGRTAAARQAGRMAEVSLPHPGTPHGPIWAVAISASPRSRKDEDRPLLFVSRWDLRLWASEELAAKDQVVVKNGLNSVHQFIAMSPSSRGQQRSFNCLSEVSVCMH
ncbi:unnamed protein product [Urochloa humidicola]